MYKSKGQKNITYLVFGGYLFLLVWLILFKFTTNFGELDHIRNLNLIPFQGSMIVNGRLALSEILYNILVFVPLGVYVSIFWPEWSFAKKVVPGFLLSLVFEIVQYIFAIGASDITDVIGNTLGGILGIALFVLLANIFKKKYLSVINGIGAVIELLAVAGLTLLFVANM